MEVTITLVIPPITISIPQLDLLGQGYSRVENKLTDVLTAVTKLTRKEETMSTQLDALTASVSKNTDVEESAITLISGLAAQIAAIKTDPVALQALSDSLSAESGKLAAAVTANTPAA